MDEARMEEIKERWNITPKFDEEIKDCEDVEYLLSTLADLRKEVERLKNNFEGAMQAGSVYRAEKKELEAKLAEAEKLAKASHPNAVKMLESYRNQIALMSSVIEAAKKLEIWCLVSHGHIPKGWKELLAAFKIYDEARKG